MTFTTVFDARTDLHASAWLLTFLMIPVAMLLVAQRRRLPLPAWAALALTMLLLAVALVVPVIAALGTYLQFRTIGAALRNNRYAVAEGQIGRLQRTTRRSRVIGESFVVGDHRFAYSCDVTIPPAFHDCGKLIEDGRTVRISYLGDTILRVEVAR